MKDALKLWFTFACHVILITLATLLITTAIALAILKPHITAEPGVIPLLPVVSLVLAGCIAAAGITLFVSKRLFLPIEQLSEAMTEVAAGNFKIRLAEDYPGSQVHQMNHNFNKMAAELNSIEMLQSDFTQNVSHEFKTPLAAIEGYAVLLNAAPLPEELHGYTERIVESTRQLSTLSGNILKLSRLEKQEIISEKESFPLDEQLREALLSLEPLWNQKNLEIDMDLPEVTYYGNANLIYQIWTNLFSNAIKFTPAHGSVSVSMAAAAAGITVRICDSGIGMTEDVQNHIFEKFYQGEHSRHIEGNGLGLALVKKIVDLCEGNIRVESAPDCGSAFTVWLPHTKVPAP